ncbi:cell division protein FtsL [Ornithinibacillus californiensis]|uniref:cell division protein FtsL n=1 Tax=Ornithinibacillus californiensis TaxID=161536 RepID=UPI00064D8122|nr:cell division protein FtsL [Ornithinibacillus californiensis]
MAANHARSWEQSYTSYQPQVEKKVVKVKKSWITKGEKMLYSFVMISLIIAGGFIVSYSSSVDTLNRDIQSLEQSIANQQIVNEGLVFEIKELSRPERITQYAKENGLTIQAAEVKQANAYNE